MPIDARDISVRDKGLFTLHLGDRNQSFPGVKFVDGVSEEPVSALTALRFHQAFGRRGLAIERVSIEPDKPAQPATANPGDGGGVVSGKVVSVTIDGFKFIPRDDATLKVDFDMDDPTPVKAEFEADLEDMDRPALLALAVDEGVTHHWNAGVDKIRKAIRAERDKV